MAIFRFRFQHFDTSGRLSKETIAMESDQATRDYGRKFANEVLQLLKKWLRPGGTYNIGASGQAAENFEIVEGGLTPANRFIREGIDPERLNIKHLDYHLPATTIGGYNRYTLNFSLPQKIPRDLTFPKQNNCAIYRSRIS